MLVPVMGLPGSANRQLSVIPAGISRFRGAQGRVATALFLMLNVTCEPDRVDVEPPAGSSRYRKFHPPRTYVEELDLRRRRLRRPERDKNDSQHGEDGEQREAPGSWMVAIPRSYVVRHALSSISAVVRTWSVMPSPLSAVLYLPASTQTRGRGSLLAAQAKDSPSSKFLGAPRSSFLPDPLRMILAVPLRSDAKIKLLKTVPLFAGSRRASYELAMIGDEMDLRDRPRASPEKADRDANSSCLSTALRWSARKDKKMADLRLRRTGSAGIALLANAPRTATVTATSPVDVLVITDRRGFHPT